MTYEWKVGMKVVVWWRGDFVRFAEIEKVTPTGLCRLKGDDDLWAKDGYRRARGLWRQYITPYNDEAKEAIESETKRKEIQRKKSAIREYSWHNASPEIIDAVYAIIKPEAGKGG